MGKIMDLPKNISWHKAGNCYVYRYREDKKTKAVYSHDLDHLIKLKNARDLKKKMGFEDVIFESESIEYRNAKNISRTESVISSLFPEEQYVYLVSDGRFVKIGVTKDVEFRVKKMQTANPYPLKVICVIKTHAPYLIETALHKILKSKRVAGEWYDILNLFENGEEYEINEA